MDKPSLKYISLCGPASNPAIAESIADYLGVVYSYGVGVDDRQVELHKVIEYYEEENDVIEAMMLSLVSEAINLRQTVARSLFKYKQGITMSHCFLDTLVHYSVVLGYSSPKRLLDIAEAMSMLKMIPSKIVYVYNKPEIPTIYAAKVNKMYQALFGLLQMNKAKTLIIQYEAPIGEEPVNMAVDILRLLGEFDEKEDD